MVGSEGLWWEGSEVGVVGAEGRGWAEVEGPGAGGWEGRGWG